MMSQILCALHSPRVSTPKSVFIISIASSTRPLHLYIHRDLGVGALFVGVLPLLSPYIKSEFFITTQSSVTIISTVVHVISRGVPYYPSYGQ